MFGHNCRSLASDGLPGLDGLPFAVYLACLLFYTMDAGMIFADFFRDILSLPWLDSSEKLLFLFRAVRCFRAASFCLLSLASVLSDLPACSGQFAQPLSLLAWLASIADAF